MKYTSLRLIFDMVGVYIAKIKYHPIDETKTVIVVVSQNGGIEFRSRATLDTIPIIPSDESVSCIEVIVYKRLRLKF